MLKITKTDWRNCLTDEAVTALIRINLESADVKEFKPDPAIHLWNNADIRGRQPNQNIWRKCKNPKQVSGYSSDSEVSDSASSDTESESGVMETNNVMTQPEPASSHSESELDDIMEMPDHNDNRLLSPFHSDNSSDFNGF